MKHLFSLIVLFLTLASFARDQEAVQALGPEPFPDRMSQYVWRNWGLVPKERLAAVVGAPVEGLAQIAEEMGLETNPVVLPEWRRRGYITLVRRNWHLLTREQIEQLVDMTEEEFAFRLKEDDFLWVKLGQFKPICPALTWSGTDPEAGRKARLEIARKLASLGVDPKAPEEPRFTFLRELHKTGASPSLKGASSASSSNPFDFRLIASYCADYGDPLADPTVDSFPEGLLAQLAENGVNAVWLHVVLNQLTTDPKYPEFGAGREQRVANLKTLVARAQKYGIRVYLYLNEPRCQPLKFFDNPAHADLKGVVEDRFAAMCTSNPETLRWLHDALKQLFSSVPGLGGVLTITMSENLTNCASHSGAAHGCVGGCPRCSKRSKADILAEVNTTIAEGVRAGNPEAETIVWNWQWPVEDEPEIVSRLPKQGCRVMAVSENGMPVTVGGVTVPENDYSISVVGPGENAFRLWRVAAENNIPCVAKVQVNCSWELSPFPYLPVGNIVAEHAARLKAAGVKGVMLSWSCGSSPAPNLRLFNGETLSSLSDSLYGSAAAPQMREAWTAFSDGFRQYPFCIETLYRGPQQWGPANPLYLKPTGLHPTMVGMPYDALKEWPGRLPLMPWLTRFEAVADGFEKGCSLFEAALPLVSADKRPQAEREDNLFRAEAMHFRSLVNQSRFILARDADHREEMRRYAQLELETARAYLPLVRADSRIGYECSNHYFYLPRDVIEKIIGCQRILDALQ